MSAITVRRAGPDDAPALVATAAALFAEDAGTRDDTMNTDWPREAGAERYAWLVEAPDRLVLVAEADGAVVGHLTGVLAEPTAVRPVRVATLSSMYVGPGHRDQRAGTRLVEAFRAWARERAADRIAVSAYAGNDDAVRFYRRQGFTPYTLVLETTP